MSKPIRPTGIPYATHGWNFAVGCPLPLISSGCQKCWARRVHNLRHKAYLEGKLQNHPQYAEPFEELQIFEDRLNPVFPKEPSIIFVLPQSDIFHEQMSPEWLVVWEAAVDHPEHLFVVLTKRADRIPDCNPTEYPDALPIEGSIPNLWLGVTVELQKYVHRIERLCERWTGNKWVSAEPLLGPLEIPGDLLKQLGWVIVGGESGPGARPMDPDWVHRLWWDFDEAFYFKQRGSNQSLWEPHPFESIRDFPSSFPPEAVERLRARERSS